MVCKIYVNKAGFQTMLIKMQVHTDHLSQLGVIKMNF